MLDSPCHTLTTPVLIVERSLTRQRHTSDRHHHAILWQHLSLVWKRNQSSIMISRYHGLEMDVFWFLQAQSVKMVLLCNMILLLYYFYYIFIYFISHVWTFCKLSLVKIKKCPKYCYSQVCFSMCILFKYWPHPIQTWENMQTYKQFLLVSGTFLSCIFFV